MDALVIRQGVKHSKASLDFCSKDDQVSVGRGFNNDIIINDPYVDAEQLKFVKNESCWQLQIIGKTNNVLLNDVIVKADHISVSSGDTVTIGRSKLELFDVNHAVEATRKLRFKSWLHSGVASVLVPILAFAVSLGLDVFSGYMISPIEYDVKVWGFIIAFSVFFALLWSGVWGLVGKGVRQQFNIGQHLLVFSLASIASFFLFSMTSYIEFALDGGGFANALTWSTACVLLIVLLRYNLLFATNIRHPLRPAAVVGVLLFAAVYMLTDIVAKEFSFSDAEYANTFQPGSIHINSSDNVESYFKHLEQELLALDTLVKEQRLEQGLDVEE